MARKLKFVRLVGHYFQQKYRKVSCSQCGRDLAVEKTSMEPLENILCRTCRDEQMVKQHTEREVLEMFNYDGEVIL